MSVVHEPPGVEMCWFCSQGPGMKNDEEFVRDIINIRYARLWQTTRTDQKEKKRVSIKGYQVRHLCLLFVYVSENFVFLWI